MKDRTGEKRIMNCGMEAEILKYHRCNNIDVLFQDGTLITHATYYCFSRGSIYNPNIKKAGAQNRVKSYREGERRVQKDGVIAEIIKYRRYKDIDIKRDDGVILFHKDYGSFLRGGLLKKRAKPGERLKPQYISKDGYILFVVRRIDCSHVEVQDEKKRKRVIAIAQLERNQVKWISYKESFEGATSRNINGLKMKCIAYDTKTKATVEFEDGAIRKEIPMGRFRKGSVGHPVLKVTSRGISTKEYMGFINLKRAFSLNNGQVFYEAVSPEGECGIWTPQQMILHQCKKQTPPPRLPDWSKDYYKGREAHQPNHIEE